MNVVILSPPARSLASALVLLGMALATEAGARPGILCIKPDGSDPRLIEIVSDGPNRVPCQTWYTKWGARQEKANAANAEGYCEKIANKIQTNLESAGFACGLTATAHVGSDEGLPHVSAPAPAPVPAREASLPPSTPTRVKPTTVSTSAVEDESPARIERAPSPAPRARAKTEPSDRRENKVVVAPVARETSSREQAAPVEMAALSHPDPPKSVVAEAAQKAAPMADSVDQERQTLTQARLRAHVDAFMTERQGCRADVDRAMVAPDDSFAVVQWFCETATSGYAAHLLALFADGTAPASLRIGGTLSKSARVRRVEKNGQVQVQTKLYKSDDPECCPSVIQVDVYRVDGSSDAGTIELLTE